MSTNVRTNNSSDAPLTPAESSRRCQEPTSTSTSTSSEAILTPFSRRSRAFSSAVTTPSSIKYLSSPEVSKSKPSATRRSVADFSANWRTKVAESSSDSPSEKLSGPVLGSPAFLSNNRRLPGSLTRNWLDSTSHPHISEDPFIVAHGIRDIGLPIIEENDRAILPSDYVVPMTKRSSPSQMLKDIPSPKRASPRRTASSTASSCAGCGSRLESISHLQPCLHAICQQCFTGLLNIVGEKGLVCPACHASIESFAGPSGSGLWSSFGAGQPTMDLVQSTSGIQLIRVDNLPWDVTPTMLASWLPVPAMRTHVLLERATGKTLSHCFLELTQSDARLVMRTCQNKAIGSGRRVRAVSVSLADKAELMREVFPSWRGLWDGAVMSVEGLGSRSKADAIKFGVLTVKEMDDLLRLMHHPESHFLKVPTLPFHSLVSILQKFPADSRSRQLWTSALRDRLFAIVQAAVQILYIRVSQQGWDGALLDELVTAGATCEALTEVQRRLIAVSNPLPDSPSSTPCESEADASPITPHYVNDLCPASPTPAPRRRVNVMEPAPTTLANTGEMGSVFERIGQDVGLDAELVRMVVQKLFV